MVDEILCGTEKETCFATMSFSGLLYIFFADVESDVIDGGWQVGEILARAAAHIHDLFTSLAFPDVAHQPLLRPFASNEMLEPIINPSQRQNFVDSSDTLHQIMDSGPN